MVWKEIFSTSSFKNQEAIEKNTDKNDYFQEKNYIKTTTIKEGKKQIINWRNFFQILGIISLIYNVPNI